MMVEEDYDIVPHKRVLDLEKDIHQIKKDPLGASTSGKQMISTMEKLSESMDKLVGLFEGASERMKQEETETEVMGQKIDPLIDKLETVIDQNQKIATGIVAVADLVKDWMEKQKRDEGAPLPPVRMPTRVAPRPAIGPVSAPPMGPPLAGPLPPGPVTRPEPLPKAQMENKMMGSLQESKPPMPPPPGVPKATPFPPVGSPTAGPPPGAPPPPPGMPVPPQLGVKPPVKKKKSIFGF